MQRQNQEFVTRTLQEKSGRPAPRSWSMEVEIIVKGKAEHVRFCSGGSLGNAACDFTSGDEGGAMPTMYVYPSGIKKWACSSVPLTLTQLQEAERHAETQEQEEATALTEAQASGALDAEIWERINRNPKETMTTEHKKYLGLPWGYGSGVIQYTQAKAILEAKSR
jgi:hypothetical protein